MTQGTFFEISARQFSFLKSEFGFQHKARRTSGGTLRDIYQNRTTAVEVALEWHEQYVYVELCRLVDGEIKENPFVVSADSELNCFNFENLLLVRAPAAHIPQQSGKALSADDMEVTLAAYSEALHKFAADVLKGQFGIFDQLDVLVKERARQAAKAEEQTQPLSHHRGNGKTFTKPRSPLKVKSHVS